MYTTERELEKEFSKFGPLQKLQVVSFEYKQLPGVKKIGLIAEQVEQVDKDLVTYKQGQVDGVKYENVWAMLLASHQQLQKRVLELEKKLSQ